MLQFLCLQMCVYGGSAVPQGGLGDRHLVTVPQGVAGDRLPWGGERQGGGGVRRLIQPCFALVQIGVGTLALAAGAWWR